MRNHTSWCEMIKLHIFIYFFKLFLKFQKRTIIFVHFFNSRFDLKKKNKKGVKKCSSDDNAHKS